MAASLRLLRQLSFFRFSEAPSLLRTLHSSASTRIPHEHANDAPSEIPGAPEGQAPGTQSLVVAELLNCPKYTLKDEILELLHGCNLTFDRVFTRLDENLHAKSWCFEFESMADFRKASEIANEATRIGTRFVQLRQLTPEQARRLETPIHTALQNFRDQSLVLTGIPVEMPTDSIDRFFSDYNLVPMAIHNFFVQAKQPGSLQPATMQRWNADLEVVERMPLRERLTVVKFETKAEALRAWREKQGSLIVDSEIELRLLQ